MIKEKFPLTMALPGKEVILVSIEGSRVMRRRLTDMGLNEGMKLKVLHSHKPGPCIVLAGETRLVLGQGMAHRILVSDIKTASKRITVALAGNPNSGKTTVFNSLTGARQRIGNYPGVTVEKKEGRLTYKGYKLNVVDLPGTYSLTAHSADEIIARNFLIEEKPDIVIHIIDSSNLERNLYLTTQLMELEVPLVLAFNMHDLAQKQGLAIDKERLSEFLASPIVFTVATKNKGMNELLDEVIRSIDREVKRTGFAGGYGKEIQEEVTKIEDILRKDIKLSQKYPSRWLATKLLEADSEVIKKIKESFYNDELKTQVQKSAHHLQVLFGDTPEALIADGRYGFISGACSESVMRTFETRHTISDKIDKILINRILGLPIFFALMWGVFKFTFVLSAPFIRSIEIGQMWLGDIFGGLLPEGSFLQSLVVDGIVGGVGSVLVFVPVIFLLFLALGFLEYSGYMARAAFIMDRFMHKIGLHGRSFIPMLLGFGCNVPAIMSTRTIEDNKDRLVTILVTPFMSCGARLPIYILFIGAFFPVSKAGNVLFSIYVVGIGIAVIMAKIFRKYFFKGEAAPFVMELPPYRIPPMKGLFIHMWERVSVYFKKAGTIIFAACIVIWFLSNFPWDSTYPKDRKTEVRVSEERVVQRGNEIIHERLEKSYAGTLGKAIAPFFRPLGFDDWKISVGLVGGFLAKEIVVGTLGTLYSISEADEKSDALRIALQNAIRDDGSKLFNPLAAYSLMVFALLYVPCSAVIIVIKRETNFWRWAFFAAVYTTAVAWIVSFIVYQGGRLLGLG